MAVIQFGDIVTGIKGSIGGTTYRQFQNGWVASRKSAGPSKNKLLENPKLPQLRDVSNAWNNLTLSQKTDWDQWRLDWEFPDRWGDLKNLSAREFFFKVQNAQINVGRPMRPTDEPTDNFQGIELANAQFTDPTTVRIRPFSNDSNDGYLAVHARPIRNETLVQVGRYAPLVFGGFVEDLQWTDISAGFFARYPYAKPGDQFGFYGQEVASEGWTDSYKSIEWNVVV